MIKLKEKCFKPKAEADNTVIIPLLNQYAQYGALQGFNAMVF